MALVALGGTMAVTGGTNGFDNAVAARAAVIRGAAGPAGTTAMQAVTTLGSFPAVIILTVLAAIGLWARTRRVPVSALLAAAVASAAGVVYLVQVALGRHRPLPDTVLGWATSYSFPSGHTAYATVLYVLAALIMMSGTTRPARWRLIVTAGVVLSILIGLSRIYLGLQWATDVLAGWLLGLGIVALARFADLRLEDLDLRPTSTADPAHAARRLGA